VKAGINEPILPFGCAAHDQSTVDGRFLVGRFPFVFGEMFPLWFQLESIAGTGFGAGRPTGAGSSTADFFNTASIADLVFYDSNMQLLDDSPTVTSALGISYEPVNPVPEPGTLTLLGTGVAILLARKRSALSGRWR